MFSASKDVLVFVGDFTKPGDVNKEVIKGARVQVHENYNGKINSNDIALIELSTTVSVNNVLPLCDRSYSSNTIAVCGMGTTNPSNNQMPSVLQEVQLKERATCAMTWNGPKKQVSYGVRNFSVTNSSFRNFQKEMLRPKTKVSFGQNQ